MDPADPTKVEAGDSVSANVNPVPGEDGTLEMSGITGDDGFKDANDESTGQGDLAG